MADFPLVGNRILVESFGFDLATSSGTVLTSASGGLTAWTELLSSSSADADMIDIFIMKGASNNFGIFRLDVGIGAPGSEVVILDRVLLSGKPGAAASSYQLALPFSVPKGSRLSFRFDASASGRELILAGALYTGQFKSQQHLCESIAYGFNGIDGVDVDPGGVANTKGAWFEIDAAISNSINGFYACFGDSSNSAQTTANFLVDIAVGAPGSEVLIAENVPTRATTQELMRGPVFVDSLIAEGDRVSARAQCTITDASDRLLSISITGFR